MQHHLESPQVTPSAPSAVQLRPYQREAIDAVRARFAGGDRSVLLVLPTGSGKTTIFSEISRLVAARDGRTLILAHRTELIEQAAARVRLVAPDLCVGLEAAGVKAALDSGVIVASVQTLSRGPRLARWKPDAFRLIVIDEAHHAPAASYQRILAHFPGARVLGVTATPDRGDGKALGEVFDSVAYERPLHTMINEGYLTPIVARTVRVDGFDLAGARIVAGDIAEGDIADALAPHDVLRGVACSLIEQAGERSTLVFMPGVDRAWELLALLDLRLGVDLSDIVLGTTPREERERVFRDFASGRTRFLINCGVATEGTDVPRCSCVAVVRPTKSRGLMVQMIGRGLRPFAPWEQEPALPDERRAAIAASTKPDCLILNFVPSNARHRLVGPIDALAPGDMSDATIDRARALAELDPELSLEEALAAASADAPQLARERALDSYHYTIESWDPFAAVAKYFDKTIALKIDSGTAEGGASVDDLVRAGVPMDVAKRVSPGFARAVLVALEDRAREGLCSLKTARQLVQRGLNPNVSAELGREAMQALQAANWRAVPKSLREDPRFAVGGAE